MFIASTRIRRVDTPDAPTPGAVPPAVPPVVPPTAEAPAATAPEPGFVPVPVKPVSKGLLIGLIAGGAALLVIAITAVVVLVLPAILGGGTTDQTDVADIGAEPDTTWKYDWVGDNDQDFLQSSPEIVAVGNDKALVWATFDYSLYSESQGNSAGWYEGYDEQYADGYAAGLEYLVAYDAWWDDTTYTVEYPDEETYFPEGAYDNYDEFLGFQDGFYDSRYEQGEGYSQKEKPVDPDYTPTIALIDATSGDEAWSIDLSDAIDGADFSSQFQAYDIEDSNAVVVVASVTDGTSVTYAAVSLDKGNGEVISTLEADGPISVASFGGDAVLGVSDENGEETTVGRYSVGALDKDPKWDASVDGIASLYIDGDFISAYSYGGDDFAVFNANNGEDADWGDDIDSDVFYSFLGSQLLRFESKDEGYEIEGYNTNGDSVWKDSIDAEYDWVGDGVLLVADADGDVYTDLQLINPSNGAESWGDVYGDEFDYVLGVQGNNLLLASGNKIIVLDLGSGEVRFSQKAGDFYGVYEGSDLYYAYTGDELAAYSYKEKGDVWTLDVDDSEDIVTVGKHLVLLDLDKGTLNGLGS